MTWEIVEPNSDLKHCRNCGYRYEHTCMLSGHSWTVERMFPKRCGNDFEKWKPMPPKKPGLWDRFQRWWDRYGF